MFSLKTPPGPKGLPLVGVGRRFRKDPAGFVLETAREFGDVSFFRVGLRKVFLVSRPDLIDEVLVHSVKYFNRLPGMPHIDFDVGAMTDNAVHSVERWEPGGSFDVADEMKRLFPPPPMPAADPDREEPSLIEEIASGHRDPAAPVASALTWTLIALAQHADVQERVRADLDGAYTKAVVSESMRLYPAVWTIGRIVRSQFRLFNYLVPTDSVCLLSSYVTHRHSRFWPEPERFDPERFLGGVDSPRPRFAYFPFGAPQICTGQEAATAAIVRLTSAIVARWRVSLDTGDLVEPWAQSAVLWPRNPVRLLVSAC